MSAYGFRRWASNKGRAYLVGRAIACFEAGALVGALVVLVLPTAAEVVRTRFYLIAVFLILAVAVAVATAIAYRFK